MVTLWQNGDAEVKKMDIAELAPTLSCTLAIEDHRPLELYASAELVDVCCRGHRTVLRTFGTP